MNKRRIVVSLFALALICGVGFRQEPTELKLTLEDSIVRALKSNLNVAARSSIPAWPRPISRWPGRCTRRPSRST